MVEVREVENTGLAGRQVGVHLVNQLADTVLQAGALIERSDSLNTTGKTFFLVVERLAWQNLEVCHCLGSESEDQGKLGN